jgi:hypothetical protein
MCFTKASPSFIHLNIFDTGKGHVSEIDTQYFKDEIYPADKAKAARWTGSTTRSRPMPSGFAYEARLDRPDMDGLIGSIVPRSSLAIPTGTLAVSACGPAGLCDSTREAVRRHLNTSCGGKSNVIGADRLVYHEEAFTW